MRFMKSVCCGLVLLVICCFVVALALPQKTAVANSDEYGKVVSQLIIQERSVFSGLVFETTQGVAIMTERGTFFLRGQNLGPVLGKNVRVTGALREKTIFAVKIDVTN